MCVCVCVLEFLVKTVMISLTIILLSCDCNFKYHSFFSRCKQIFLTRKRETEGGGREERRE